MCIYNDDLCIVCAVWSGRVVFDHNSKFFLVKFHWEKHYMTSTQRVLTARSYRVHKVPRKSYLATGFAVTAGAHTFFVKTAAVTPCTNTAGFGARAAGWNEIKIHFGLGVTLVVLYNVSTTWKAVLLMRFVYLCRSIRPRRPWERNFELKFFFFLIHYPFSAKWLSWAHCWLANNINNPLNNLVYQS